MTRINDFFEEQELARAGFSFYFPKPAVISDLQAALASVVNDGATIGTGH